LAAFLTVYSLGAIVTSGVSLDSNFYTEGGPYYIASRSLGLHIGGTIGIFYFSGLLLLAMLEILGAVEVFHNSSGISFYGS
jgi:hypothetical protein